MDLASIINAVPAGAGGAPSPDPAGALAMAPDPAAPPLPLEMGAPPPGLLPSGPLPPMSAPQGQGPMYPTTDPSFMAELLMQVSASQQADHDRLAQEQQAALMSNPVMEALMAGAPMGPGAGRDGAALGAPSGVLPPPMGV